MEVKISLVWRTKKCALQNIFCALQNLKCALHFLFCKAHFIQLNTSLLFSWRGVAPLGVAGKFIAQAIECPTDDGDIVNQPEGDEVGHKI